VFFEPQPTQFDLNFRIFGIHVRVHPWFWLMSALLGWHFSRLGLQYVLVWIVCVFISILVHELGHVFMGQLFGARSHIVLHAFGGLAIGSSNLRNRWQRIAVYLAGPAAGFLLWGLVWLIDQGMDPERSTRIALLGVHFLLWINLAWGFLNLLPIWPLDGGQVSRDFLDWLIPHKGVRIALVISIVLSGLIAINCIAVDRLDHSLPILDLIPWLEHLGGLYNALLFASLALNSYQALQMEAHRRPWDRDSEY
jgi:Zn-dependent protease